MTRVGGGSSRRRVRVDPDRVDERPCSLGVGIERAESEHHVHAGGLQREHPVGVRRRRAGRDDHVLAAAALVGTHLAEHAALALPEVRDTARGRTGRQLDDQRAGLVEIEEVQGVRRRRVRGDQPEPVAVAHVVHEVGAGGAEHLVVLRAPLRVRHQRQRPQVRLARQLVVELVEHPRHVPTGRKLTIELNLAQTARQRPPLHLHHASPQSGPAVGDSVILPWRECLPSPRATNATDRAEATDATLSLLPHRDSDGTRAPSDRGARTRRRRAYAPTQRGPANWRFVGRPEPGVSRSSALRLASACEAAA